MNAVIGMSGLLLDTTAAANANSPRSSASGGVAARHHQRHLDFSKIDAGRLELKSHRRPAGLRRVWRSTRHRTPRRKGLELAFLIDPSIPVGVSGERHPVRQVMVNLLANAVKFTESASRDDRRTGE